MIKRRELSELLYFSAFIMTPNIRIALFSAAFVLLSSVQYACAADTLKLMVKGITVPVEVAADNASREKGLMFRKHLPENSGMLFVMDRSDAVCMWMKNTLIPLSVAFIDKDGFIINIEEMKPLTLDIHCSKAKAFSALEMNESWFEKNHVKPGDKISRLPQLRQTN